MDSLQVERRYTSRWSHDPIRDTEGRLKLVQLTGRDLEILKLLARYRYLRADFIHAFVGSSIKGLVGRLNQLQRPPNRFIVRPEAQRLFAHADYRYLIYELGPAGKRTLQEFGLWNDSICRLGDERQFAHAMMINDTLGSIELGIQSVPATRLVPWSEIASHPRFPEATRRLARPHTLSVPSRCPLRSAGRIQDYGRVSRRQVQQCARH